MYSRMCIRIYNNSNSNSRIRIRVKTNSKEGKFPSQTASRMSLCNNSKYRSCKNNSIFVK